jgi:hypothetical protein
MVVNVELCCDNAGNALNGDANPLSGLQKELRIPLGFAFSTLTLILTALYPESNKLLN